MATAVAAAPWKRRPTLVACGAGHGSDQGPPSSVSQAAQLPRATLRRGEDDNRDLREARARPRRRRVRLAQDQQKLSASPVPWTDDWDPTLEPDELDEFDSEVARPRPP